MTLGVTVLPKEDNGVGQAIMNAFSEFQRRKEVEGAAKTQASQFDATLGEQKRLTDEQIRQNKLKELDGRAGMLVDFALKQGDSYNDKGEKQKGAETAVAQLKRFDDMFAASKDPDAAVLRDMIHEKLFARLYAGPDTNADSAKRNESATANAITGRTATAQGVVSPTSGATASDLAFTEKRLGADMTAPVFADVQAQGEGAKQHARYLDVAEGLAPDANTLAQTSSNERIQRGHDAATSGGNSAVMGSVGAGSGASGDEFLKTLPPDLAGVVRKIANYEVDPVQAASLRKGSKDAESERLQLIRMATQYDPNYDMTQFPARKQARLDFNPGGKTANSIKSLNTAIAHLDELAQAADSLGNVGGVPLLNTAINAGKNFVTSQSGGDSTTKFHNAATAVDAELAAALKGGGATDQEIKAWQGGMDQNMSPEQLRAAIKTRVDLMAGRIKAIASQQGKPSGATVLTQHSRDILNKLGFNSNDIEGGTGSDAGSASGGSVITDPNHVLSLFTARQ